MVFLSELCAVLGADLAPVGGRSLPARELTGVHVSELADPTPYLDGGELLLTTGMPLGGSPAATRQYVERLRARGVHALGIGLGPWLASVPGYLAEACDEAQIQLLAVPDGVPFQNVSRSYWGLCARSGQAELLGSLGTQTSLAQAAMRPGGAAAVVRGLAQALGGWAAFLPAGPEPVRYWPESTSALLPQLREETIRLNRAGTHSAATFELHGQPVVEYPITAGGRMHGFLAVGPGRKLAAPDRQVIMTVCTLLALKARQREAATGAAAVLEGAVAKLILHGHTEAARILAEDAGHSELPRRVRVLALAAGPGGQKPAGSETGGPGPGTEALLASAQQLVPAAGIAPLPDPLAACTLRHERDGVLYVLLPEGSGPETGTGVPAGPEVPVPAGAVSDPVSLAEVPGALPGLRRALGQAAPGMLAGVAGPAHAAAEAWVRTLAEYPKADLAGTVTEYLRHRGHWENASRALGVHRNSLRHRIALASSLLGVNLDDPDVFAPLWLELRQRGR
ncbi:MAG: PucR family transcriptional regulator [Arthrobacter sp.]